MPKAFKQPPVPGGKALEMTMRDVLDGLEDFATLAAYEASGGVFEILSIEPPNAPTAERATLPSPAEERHVATLRLIA